MLALVLARRSEGARPGDIPLCHGGASRKALLGVALLLLAAGATLLIGAASRTAWIVPGIIGLYAAVLTAAVGLASKVRPHLLRADGLLLRWGLHQELAVPLGSVRSIEVERPQRGRRRADTASERFPVPSSGRELVVLQLAEPIEVSTSFGRHRLVQAIQFPADLTSETADFLASRRVHVVRDPR